MTALTQAEQLFLELTNRARLDPQAEADRQGITLNQFIVPGTPGAPISADPKQPLAGSNLLTVVAEKHAAVVMNRATQAGSINFNAHDGAGDGAVNDRIKNGGYVQTWENGCLLYTSDAADE